MEKTIENFRPAHPFLVCIDSDGCAYDVMEVKHKECFCPAAVNLWDLQAVDRYAREAWEFVNLYSVDRGINRFLALEKVLEMLDEREEVKRLTGFSMPAHDQLKAWTRSGEPLNQQSLETHMDQEQLARTLRWSEDCNRRIREMVRGVPPFPYVRESLEKLADHADIVIVSATSTEALLREWEEHRLLPLVSAVCGQEAGSKAECIARAMKGYAPSRCLMLGDAPGNAAAAGKNGILFYPIRPLEETDSWQEFYQEYLDAFLEERYEGELQRKAEERFRRLLPETPPWKQEAKRES